MAEHMISGGNEFLPGLLGVGNGESPRVLHAAA